MNVQQIRFNQDLFKNKIKLENKLKMINNEIKVAQENCDHVCIVSGYVGNTYSRNNSIKECLFCRTQEFDPEKKYPTIYGYTYKRNLYGNGEEPQAREERVNEILELWIKIQKEFPNATLEQIAIQIDSEISLDEQKNKAMEKSLKHPIADRKKRKD